MASLLSFLGIANASPLEVGAVAPTLAVVTDSGQTLQLAEVYARGLTLVYFYPKADTPGCTAQGCSLRDAFDGLQSKGVTVIGASTDTVEAQRAFKAKHRLPFTLVADTEKKLMTAFGQDGIPVVGLASRQAYLINKDGKIVWRDLKASTKQQAEDVLAVIKTLGL